MCKRLMRSHVTSDVFACGVVVSVMKITDCVVAAPLITNTVKEVDLIYF